MYTHIIYIYIYIYMYIYVYIYVYIYICIYIPMAPLVTLPGILCQTTY